MRLLTDDIQSVVLRPRRVSVHLALVDASVRRADVFDLQRPVVGLQCSVAEDESII